MAATDTVMVHVVDTEGNEILEVELVMKNTVRTLKTLAAEACKVPPLCQIMTSEKTKVVLQDSDTMDVVYFNGKNINMMMTIILGKTLHSVYEFLAHPNGDLKSVALKLLGRLGEEDFDFARDTILACVEDNLPVVRVSAIDTLVHISDALETLEKHKELKDFRKACLKTLAGRCADCEQVVRNSASEALLVFAMGESAAVKALRPHATHLNKCVRQDVLMLLGCIAKRGDAEAIKILCAGFEDVDTEVRRAAAAALAKVGDVSALPALAKLSEKAEFDEIRCLALSTLPALVPKKDSDEAIATIIEHMRDEVVEVRLAAVSSLAGAAPFDHEAALIALVGQLGYRRPKKPPPPPPPKPEGEESEEEEPEPSEAESDSDKEPPPPPPPPPPPEPIIVPNADPDEHVLAAALTGLVDLAPETDVQVRTIFLRNFSESSAVLRRTAADGLLRKFATKDDPEVVPAMVALTMHGLGDVRYQAVNALAALVGRGERKPEYFETPPPSKDQLVLEAERYVRNHEKSVAELKVKIKDMKGKPVTVKTTKRRRMLKATLKELNRSVRYLQCVKMIKLNDLESRLAELQEIVDAQETRIAEVEHAIATTKKANEKRDMGYVLESMKDSKEYLQAKDELKEVLQLRDSIEKDGDGGLSGEALASKDGEPKAAEDGNAAKDKKEVSSGTQKTGDLAGQVEGAAEGASGNAEGEEGEAGETGEAEAFSEEEGLSDEEVFPQFLAVEDSDDEEARRERLADAASAAFRRVPRGPVTALVHRVLEDTSWEVQRVSLEALLKLAHAGRTDVVEAARPLVTHPRGDIRTAAIRTLAAKAPRGDEALQAAFTLRAQDKNPAVVAAALDALAVEAS